jgi:hypothetical protein
MIILFLFINASMSLISMNILRYPLTLDVIRKGTLTMSKFCASDKFGQIGAEQLL